ncbi:hypothetical protein [Paenibacillus xylanexedens]|uniref:hypothetical protein n=1 Tax=Paenibacillus xylanexedens TaxID=528191 RepID=UPI000F53F77C|nr:hypothetical protein [Paenibacillus xylanexedens]RPK19967.1 hypothetical protein EDO6_06484 [Paenibacillus xylanexedens]
MQIPELVIGKSAIYFDRDKVPHAIRVMVTKHIDGDEYIVSDFDNPSVFYKTGGWHFTIEKEKDQPDETAHAVYLSAYEDAIGA